MRCSSRQGPQSPASTRRLPGSEHWSRARRLVPARSRHVEHLAEAVQMPTDRRWVMTATVEPASGGSFLYAIGGQSMNATQFCSGSLSKMQAYDGNTNRWTTKAPLPQPTHRGLAGRRQRPGVRRGGMQGVGSGLGVRDRHQPMEGEDVGTTEVCPIQSARLSAASCICSMSVLGRLPDGPEQSQRQGTLDLFRLLRSGDRPLDTSPCPRLQACGRSRPPPSPGGSTSWARKGRSISTH